jgi:hypothetical protein
MNYIEELIAGQTFNKDGHIFILTTDYKKDGSKLAVSMENGSMRWLKPNDIISLAPIFTQDENNNVIPIVSTVSQSSKIS